MCFDVLWYFYALTARPLLSLFHLPTDSDAAIEKTYILPRGVRGARSHTLSSPLPPNIDLKPCDLYPRVPVSVCLVMSQTVTAEGITNKNLLLGLSTGQVGGGVDGSGIGSEV